MMTFIGAHFPYLVMAAMAVFAGVMIFVTIEDAMFTRRTRRTRNVLPAPTETAMGESARPDVRPGACAMQESYKATA
jgi:hypothetical protein